MYSQEEKDKMAMKNSTIDKFAARQGCPPGQISDGKGGCKDRIKNPSEGVFQDFGTRLTATQIKMRESDKILRGDALDKKYRTLEDQKALDKDQKLYQYKEQEARLAKEREAAKLKKDKAKIKEMQNKGGYKKQGF
jgi:hypothetical protein